MAARDLSFHLSLQNPGGDVDSTVVRVEGLRVRIGDDSVEGALTLRTPVSDPDVDVRVQGIVDLADIARTVKLEGVEELTGVVSANAAIPGTPVRPRRPPIRAGRGAWQRDRQERKRTRIPPCLTP